MIDGDVDHGNGPETEPMPERLKARALAESIPPDFRERFGRKAYEAHASHRTKARPWSHLRISVREGWARVAAAVFAEAARDP